MEKTASWEKTCAFQCGLYSNHPAIPPWALAGPIYPRLHHAILPLSEIGRAVLWLLTKLGQIEPQPHEKTTKKLNVQARSLALKFSNFRAECPKLLPHNYISDVHCSFLARLIQCLEMSHSATGSSVSFSFGLCLLKADLIVTCTSPESVVRLCFIQ